jgi:uncharacterized damage-inducible protein DinB
MSLSRILIDHKNGIRARTMDMVKKVPEDKLNWRPTEGVLSVGQLVHHIGQADMAWLKVLSRVWELGQFLTVRLNMDLLDVIGEVNSLTDEVQSLEITHQEIVKWMAAQSDEQLEQVYEGGGRTLSAREIVLGLCEHESHHRGQLVTYLRLLEVQDPRPWGF